MTRRIKRPPNEDAIAAANAAVYNLTDPPGRKVDPNSEADEALRKKWMDAYVAAGGKLEEDTPRPCPPEDLSVPCPYTKMPLCFTVSRYRDYENYSWSRFYRTTDYHEIGLGFGYRGDPQAVEPMLNGYVYIYRGSGSSTLWRVFSISGGQYREVLIRGGAVNYEQLVGPARDHVRIEDYFPGEYRIPERIVIIDSDIRLSATRLAGQPYSLSSNPAARGYNYQLSYSRMLDAPMNPPSGAQILTRYRDGEPGHDLATYDLQQRTFDGDIGFNLRRPHAFNEVLRRNDIYRQRLKGYQTWLNDENRNKEGYIHQTIAAILQRDSERESSINMTQFRAWSRNDLQAYREHFFPFHYATESLIEWLDDRLFQQWLLDYNHSEDDDVQEAGLRAYVGGIFELSYSDRGRQYLRVQFSNDRSFFNMATHLPAIRREYTDPDAHSNFAVEIRKTSNVFFAVLQEFAGLIVRESGGPSEHARRISEWLAQRGVELQGRQGRVSRAVGSMVSHVNIERLESWTAKTGRFANSVHGRSIISFFEVINLGIAVKGISDAHTSRDGDGYHYNLLFTALNAAGATADIASSGLLERYTQRVIQRRGWSISRIHYLAIFSGIVDFVVGAITGYREFQSGDYDAALGWTVFATGGVIVAIGGYLQLTGGGITVGSGGTAVVPGGAIILAGFAVEAIGLLWVWLANDDELDEWLVQCRFGSRSAGRSLEDDIRKLNVVMCKFEVDADFVSDTHVKIEIRPHLFTEDSTLELTRLGTTATARFIEYFIGDRGDTVTGGASLGSVTISAGETSHYAKIYREGQRISKITVDLYGRQDIDGISGDARLVVGPAGYLHGYSTNFNIKKGFFE